ncbi:hypothetical protein ACFE04_007158 [Oxalis oulophora]
MSLDSSSSSNSEQQVSTTTDPSSSSSTSSLSRNSSFNTRLNANAPAFVPRTPTTTNTAVTQQQFVIPPRQPPPPIMNMNMYVHAPPPPPPPTTFHVISPVHPHPHHYIHHQHHQHHHHHRNQNQQDRFEDVDHDQKIVNQVEYYFSDLNLATTDQLMRYITKDPQGYVPISVVSSFRKIKAFTTSNSHLATILRNSSKLEVSKDGKKVRRQQPITESDVEELQSRIIVAENLPEDHCHQNLMKIFSAVGSVKTIRTCQPQTSGGGNSTSRSAKSDNMHFNNKLHAFVEYESVELAEKAVAELNDEANWRSGLRVRLMFRRMAKTAQSRGRKGHDGEGQYEEEDASTSEQVPNEKQWEDTPQQSDFNNSHERAEEEHVHEKEGGGQRKGQSKGRSKGRGRAHNNNHQNSRGNHVGKPSNNNVVSYDQSLIGKQPPGPRMPDGTRGFSMGRGKPITAKVA